MSYKFYINIYNFNPRSREGSDKYASINPDAVTISIRAPARGATNVGLQIDTAGVFQSALPRGERQNLKAVADVLNVFQSALPRGERRSLPERRWLPSYFNPRSREGSDGAHKDYDRP